MEFEIFESCICTIPCIVTHCRTWPKLTHVSTVPRLRLAHPVCVCVLMRIDRGLQSDRDRGWQTDKATNRQWPSEQHKGTHSHNQNREREGASYGEDGSLGSEIAAARLYDLCAVGERSENVGVCVCVHVRVVNWTDKSVEFRHTTKQAQLQKKHTNLWSQVHNHSDID